jgi:hypothetical protein
MTTSSNNILLENNTGVLCAVPTVSVERSADLAENWEYMRSEFEAFCKKHGHLPDSFKGDYSMNNIFEKSLYTWWRRQRDRYDEYVSKPHFKYRVDALNALEFWTVPRKLNYKRKREEINNSKECDEGEKEIAALQPAQKRPRIRDGRPTLIWKISQLREELKEKDALIQKQKEIMECQYNLIEELKASK